MKSFFKLIIASVFTLASYETYAQDNAIEGVFTASFTGTSYENLNYLDPLMLGVSRFSENRNYEASAFQLIRGDSRLFENATYNDFVGNSYGVTSDSIFGVSNGLNFDFGNNNVISFSGFAIGRSSNPFNSSISNTSTFSGTGIFANTELGGDNFIEWNDSLDFPQPVGPTAGTSTISFRLNFLTPVPEPESYAMFLAGLGLFSVVRRFKK